MTTFKQAWFRWFVRRTQSGKAWHVVDGSGEPIRDVKGQALLVSLDKEPLAVIVREHNAIHDIRPAVAL